MRFELDESEEKLTLDFEIRKEGGLRDKSIGRVHVPVMDLEDYTGGVRYVCYQMKGSNDEAAGLLNFSYGIEDKDYRNFHEQILNRMLASLIQLDGLVQNGTKHQQHLLLSQNHYLRPRLPLYTTLLKATIHHNSAPYPSDQSPPTSSFGSYQPETSCMEPRQAPMGPPSALYLPIPAQAEGHHAPPSLQVWPHHPSEITAPLNPGFSAAQPPLLLPHFRPAFPPIPPALPFPLRPPHLYYHHPPSLPPDHQFRPCPFGFPPHDPPYWR